MDGYPLLPCHDTTCVNVPGTCKDMPLQYSGSLGVQPGSGPDSLLQFVGRFGAPVKILCIGFPLAKCCIVFYIQCTMSFAAFLYTSFPHQDPVGPGVGKLRNADIGKLLNVELSKSPFALALQRASKQLVVLDRILCSKRQ